MNAERTSAEIRVLVVDDLPAARRAIRAALEEDPAIVVVGEASNGQEAVEMAARLLPDVITMDVVMPVLDGYAATARIMAQRPTPVVAVTSLSTTDGSVLAGMLGAGAIDLVVKGFPRHPARQARMRRELIAKVKAAAQARVRVPVRPGSLPHPPETPLGRSVPDSGSPSQHAGTPSAAPHPREEVGDSSQSARRAAREGAPHPPGSVQGEPPANASGREGSQASHAGGPNEGTSTPGEGRDAAAGGRAGGDAGTAGRSGGQPRSGPEAGRGPTHRVEVIVVAASTGGPGALWNLFSQLPSGLPCPLLVVQHIAAGFGGWLASWLDQAGSLRVKVARDGEHVVPGWAYLAPEEHHLLVTPQLNVRLNEALPVHSLRPSADVLFRSAAQSFGPGAVGVVLTGMGNDGADGAACIKEAGGTVIVQDAETSAVFGMPRAAISAGAASVVLPIQEIAGRLVRLCEMGVRS